MPGHQLARAVALAVPPWHWSPTTAICCVPESHFLDKHGLPHGKRGFSSVEDGMQAAPSAFLGSSGSGCATIKCEAIIYSGHNPPASCISCHKNLLHFQRFHKEIFPQKIPVFEQNQKRNEVLLLCFGFPIGHAEYLITASQRHEFLFGFLPQLLWLILAQEQISGCSQWTLLFCPDLAAPTI